MLLHSAVSILHILRRYCDSQQGSNVDMALRFSETSILKRVAGLVWEAKVVRLLRGRIKVHVHTRVVRKYVRAIKRARCTR
jgi:hypothetical protein